jgi:hypothetical protein
LVALPAPVFERPAILLAARVDQYWNLFLAAVVLAPVPLPPFRDRLAAGFAAFAEVDRMGHRVG